MTKELQTLADEVTDETSFLEFMAALGSDWDDERAKETRSSSLPYGPGANGWENGTIGTFLDAAVTWGKASVKGLPFYNKPENPWQRAAQILHAGKCYE